jgi:hypothetical protein
MRYIVQATYIAEVELEVEVEDNADPKDPNTWIILSEHQRDYHLDDIESIEVLD